MTNPQRRMSLKNQERGMDATQKNSLSIENAKEEKRKRKAEKKRVEEEEKELAKVQMRHDQYENLRAMIWGCATCTDLTPLQDFMVKWKERIYELPKDYESYVFAFNLVRDIVQFKTANPIVLDNLGYLMYTKYLANDAYQPVRHIDGETKEMIKVIAQKTLEENLTNTYPNRTFFSPTDYDLILYDSLKFLRVITMSFIK